MPQPCTTDPMDIRMNAELLWAARCTVPGVPPPPPPSPKEGAVQRWSYWRFIGVECRDCPPSCRKSTRVHPDAHSKSMLGLPTPAGGGAGSQPRRYRVPGQPLLNQHQMGGVSRSPDGLFAQQEWEPIRGRPAVRGKRTYGGRPGQRVEEQGTWASHTQKHSEAGYGRPVDRGAWTAKTVKRPRQQPAHPQYANYWAPLTRKRHSHATSSTAPAHQRRGPANAETTPAGAPAAAADRTQRPDATCEGKNG